MAKGISFDIASGKRIARSVRKTEADNREVFGERTARGQILTQRTMLWGKLDADLAYNDTTGVAFSIWELNDSNVWADTTENIDLVFPPFELAHAMVPSGVKIQIEQRGGKWCVSKFPVHYQGVLAGNLAVAGTATVTVGSDSFTGCKALDIQAAQIDSGAEVRITLHSDGYYYVDLTPC